MTEKRNTVTKITNKNMPQIVNYFKCQFPAKSINESYARTMISAFVSQLDPTVSEMADLKTAVSEAVTNAIVHGYRECPKESLVYLSAKYTSDRIVIIEIKDKGCGIPDINKALEPTFTTAPSEERSGMGFTVMASFCDRIKVTSCVGKGTTVTLEKRLSST